MDEANEAQPIGVRKSDVKKRQLQSTYSYNYSYYNYNYGYTYYTYYSSTPSTTSDPFNNSYNFYYYDYYNSPNDEAFINMGEIVGGVVGGVMLCFVFSGIIIWRKIQVGRQAASALAA